MAHYADPRSRRAYLFQFDLLESPRQVADKMGQPTQIADLGPGYQTWFYQVHQHDKHDFSHTFCFRTQDRKLISIVRNTEYLENVDGSFPAAESGFYLWPNREKPQYGVRVRRLDGDRLLVAMGVRKPGDLTTQLQLVHRSALRFFLPWLEEQLAAEEKKTVSVSRAQ
jgi:hypothetical protein